MRAGDLDDAVGLELRGGAQALVAGPGAEQKAGDLLVVGVAGDGPRRRLIVRSADWQKRVTVRSTVYESALLVMFRSPMRMRMLMAMPREAPVLQPGTLGAFIRDPYLWPTAPKASEYAVLHRTLLGNLWAASLAIDLLNAM